MLVVFCSDPMAPRHPDPDYVREHDAATACGLESALVDFEALVNDGDAARAVRWVPVNARPRAAVYRGWMLTPSRYAELYRALIDRGVALVNDPAAYRHCHWLPESYEVIRGHTPATVWVPGSAAELGERMDEIAAAVRAALGDGPAVVKDYVKSQKHYWAEACFIASVADAGAVRRVALRFLELQGEDLSGGLVFRAFVDLEQVGRHPVSGMPLGREFRTFYADGRPVWSSRYWGEAEYEKAAFPSELAPVARSVRSRFFTMDIARTAGQKWMVVELGDGQVSGLPDGADAREFYERLKGAWAEGDGGR